MATAADTDQQYLYRKFHQSDIEHTQLQETLATFDLEWAHKHHQSISVVAIREAGKSVHYKIKQYSINISYKTQLTSLILLVEDDWVFVVADGLLTDIGTSEHMTSIRVAL